jgi:hypothetical protein
MNERFQMREVKNWILPEEMNVNRFFWDSHWLEIWSNHLCPSIGPNGGSVAMDSDWCMSSSRVVRLSDAKVATLLAGFDPSVL